MNLRRTLLLFSFIFASSLAIAQPKDRWTIQDDGAIRWNITFRCPSLRCGCTKAFPPEPKSCFPYASHASQ